MVCSSEFFGAVADQQGELSQWDSLEFSIRIPTSSSLSHPCSFRLLPSQTESKAHFTPTRTHLASSALRDSLSVCLMHSVGGSVSFSFYLLRLRWCCSCFGKQKYSALLFPMKQLENVLSLRRVTVEWTQMPLENETDLF